MGLSEDLTAEVATIFRAPWSVRDGTVIPAPADLRLGNDAVKLAGTVLYADMADSTGLVDTYQAAFAAEVYKAFLTCCARIIKARGGTITAYDGDRVMAVFIGSMKNTNAAKCALQINYAMNEIIRPKLKAQYPNTTYVPAHSVGVDTSELFIARIGVRNDNDLVWVGRAANYAAKLCILRDGAYTSWITATVYGVLENDAKTGANGQPMWEARTWTARNNMSIYRSSWQWKPD